jgi:predicted small lipoprotein YifL
MKPTFIALLALCLCLVGCGKKGAGQLAQTSQPEPTPKGETLRTEPKQESQAIKPGTVLWEFVTGHWVKSSAIGSDGMVYVGLIAPDTLSGINRINPINGKLYAIKTESQGLAKSPWPMFGQNPQHTGRVPGQKTHAALPTGKTFVWTAGVNGQSLDRFYEGKPQTQVQKTFGQPDKTQGNWWGYTGMNITDASGNKYGTAWFDFATGVVKQVRFDK